MSWSDYLLARQYLVETHIGTRVREEKHLEEQRARMTAKNLSKRR